MGIGVAAIMVAGHYPHAAFQELDGSEHMHEAVTVMIPQMLSMVGYKSTHHGQLDLIYHHPSQGR